MRAVHCADPPLEPRPVGWRSVARNLGVRGLGPGGNHLVRRSWWQLGRRQFGAPKTIAVFGPGGGVGKTTTALHLGQVLAMVRGDLAVALDANPHSGNLVKRIHEPHSPRGAGGLSRAAQSLSSCTDLTPYVTHAETGLWVVRSDPDAGSRLGAAEYQRILQVLSTYASLLVIDLGTDMREQAFLAVAQGADAFVVVAPPEAEGVEAAIDALDGANERFPGQSRASVVVMNAARAQPHRPDIGELAAGSQLFADQVVYVPHDPHLATGGICRWDLLSQRTQDAYLNLTATVVTLLHEQEHPTDELAPPQPGA